MRPKHQELHTPLTASDAIDIFVPFDSICYRRKHTSLWGIGIAVGILTGFNFDFETLSKYYLDCVSAIRDLWRDCAEYHIRNSPHY